MKAVQLKPPQRRRLRQPSGRNLQVYRQVRELGATQAAVAERMGVSQERVSQICRQVERWLARCAQRDACDDGPQANLVLARMRYQKMFALAAAELAKGDVQLVTEKVRQTGDQQRTERTTRSLPLSPQWGKLVVTLADRLERLDAKLGPDEAWELTGMSQDPHPGPLPEGEGGRIATFSTPQASAELNSSITSTSAGAGVRISRGDAGDDEHESDLASMSCDEPLACGV